LIGFFKIKSRHPDGLNKKTDLGGKKQQWEPCLGQTSMVSMTKQWNRENKETMSILKVTSNKICLHFEVK